MGLLWVLVITEVALDKARLYPLAYAVRGWNKAFTPGSKEEIY
jgi:hypothetical protein